MISRYASRRRDRASVMERRRGFVLEPRSIQTAPGWTASFGAGSFSLSRHNGWKKVDRSALVEEERIHDFVGVSANMAGDEN
jgi:hypothetical protein